MPSAYDEIKQRVIDLQYAPGEKLSEARLAEELKCGRSPIRTAFSRLQSEGFIAVSPQSGTYVRTLTEQEIRDIFECRLLLETHVTKLAAANIEAEELRKLRVAFRRLAPQGAQAFEQDLFDDFNELDTVFHSTIYRAAGNAIITDILLNLLEKARWLKKSSPSTPQRMKVAFREIEQVLEALEERDADAAAERMRQHIGKAEEFGAAARELAAAHQKLAG
jgi:DNA-binding GntR family transcriptional regulator